MEKLGHFLTLTDYLVIVASLLVCICVGIFHGRRKKKSSTPRNIDHSEEYFLGGGNMSIYPIAVSMLATSMSAVHIVSGVGEMYRFGMEYIFASFGIQIGKVLAGYMIVPVFKYLKYVSIYKYLENRFDRCMRLTFSSIYLFQNITVAAVALYLPSLLLTHVTGFPYWITACVSGVICTCYCAMGGFKTVVWTDVIQFVFMLTSVIVIIIQGSILSGGSSVVWTKGINEGFFRHMSWLDNSRRRFTVVSSVIFGIFMALQHFSTNQAVVQRILCVKDTKSAQRALLITAFLGIIFCSFLVGSAAVIYTFFRDCDPQLIPEVTGVRDLDVMFMYAIQIFLKGYQGLPGIVFAGVFSSSLSTISSYINSFAAITLEDFIKPYCVISEKREIMISKLLTAGFGAVVIVLSFIIPYLGGALQAFTSVSGAIGGPLTGLMFLAMFAPRVNKKASLVGLLFGISFCLWLTIVSPMYKSKVQTLPFSTSNCLENVTIYDKDNFTRYENFTTDSENWELELDSLNKTEKNRAPFFLYEVSFVWYGPMGLILTFVIGFLTSCMCFKPKDHIVDPLLFSPYVQSRATRLYQHQRYRNEEKEVAVNGRRKLLQSGGNVTENDVEENEKL